MTGTRALNVANAANSSTEVSSISDISNIRGEVAYPDTKLSEEEKLHRLEKIYHSEQ